MSLSCGENQRTLGEHANSTRMALFHWHGSGVGSGSVPILEPFRVFPLHEKEVPGQKIDLTPAQKNLLVLNWAGGLHT